MEMASIRFRRQGQAFRVFPVGEDHRAQNFVAQETTRFSPSVIGVFRFSFLRNKFLFDEHLNHTTPESLGFGYDPVSKPRWALRSFKSMATPQSAIRLPGRAILTRILSIIPALSRGFAVDTNSNSEAATSAPRSMCCKGSPPTDSSCLPASRSTMRSRAFCFGQPVFFLQGRGDFSRGIPRQCIECLRPGYVSCLVPADTQPGIAL